MKKIIIAASIALFASTANAEILDQYSTQDASYANVRQNNADGYVVADIYEEAAGLQKRKWLRLITIARNADGLLKYERWQGVIPNDEAMSINGVARATINVDTCLLTASFASSNGCGVVNLTVTKDPLAFGSTSAGAYAYNYGDFVMQYAGTWSTHNSTATGSVNGISIDTAANAAFGASRAVIGRYTNVSVTVYTAP